LWLVALFLSTLLSKPNYQNSDIATLLAYHIFQQLNKNVLHDVPMAAIKVHKPCEDPVHKPDETNVNQRDKEINLLGLMGSRCD